VSGVTTVSHHNPYDAEVFDTAFPVRVVKRFGWAHSLRFCAKVKERFRLTPPRVPFIIHAGEGTDLQAKNEAHVLDYAGILGSSTVLVHGVAFQDQELELIQRRGASVVWCPTSNRFMLGTTLSLAALDADIPIALGTDSALTGEGDLIDEVASACRHADPCRVYDMVTIDAARIMRLKNGEGTLRDGGIADLVVVRDEGLRPADALSVLRPELVMVNGRVKLLSDEMANRLSAADLSGFEPIEIEGRGHFLVDCRVSEAFNCAVQHLGADFRLAGKRVLI
jgi:cytosine/adenosine deaminase-related metal-dependent hydrolase